MKKRIKLALIAAFFAITVVVSSYSLGTIANASPEAESPRSLYVQNCARCHGSDGKANTKMGRKLEAADLTSPDVQAKSSASIARTIKNGRPDMPAFGKRLRPSQISAIADYVRSF